MSMGNATALSIVRSQHCRLLRRASAGQRPATAARPIAQLLVVLIALFGLFASPAVYAECGTKIDCIAVSINASPGPQHGSPESPDPSGTLNFGSVFPGIPIGSAPKKPVFVGAVTGPPLPDRATISSIDFGGADSGDFVFTGVDCTTGSPSL